jgi:hypothetical protein
MAASKSASRKSAAKKAAKTRKSKAAAKKASKTRKPRAAGKKAAVTRKRRPVAKKALPTRQAKVAVAPKAKATVATSEIDGRIAIVRNNLRDLVEQAASFSGAANEELMSQRIAEQEAKLDLLKKQRAEMLQRES